MNKLKCSRTSATKGHQFCESFSLLGARLLWQTCEANSLSLCATKFAVISSRVLPTGGPEGMNTHGQSEQPQRTIPSDQIMSRAMLHQFYRIIIICSILDRPYRNYAVQAYQGRRCPMLTPEIIELCKQASVEQDVDRLLYFVTEINRLIAIRDEERRRPS
jgi:hypothetical protein